MKRFCWIGILVLLAFAACDTTTREARRMVKRAEQLADTLPDSTVSLIDSVLRMPASFSERERMDMALLQAEALFGDHGQEISPVMDDDFFDEHANLSTSPELERAAAYYAGKKHYAKAAHAALYSGFVQQHYNEKEAAMRSFKEAEQYGKLAVDSLTVAQAEYSMGKMLYNEGREEEALNIFISSERSIGNHYTERAIIENSKAVVYILMGQHGDAELCLRQSFLYAEKGHSDRVKCKIHNNYSVLYRLEGKYNEALYSLQQMIYDSSLDDTERYMLYLNLGNVFFDLKEIDSSANYYQRMETNLPTVNVKKETIASAYEALSRFAESQNDAALALEYREKHEKILYDLMIQQQEQTIYRIQQQYDYESLQNKMIQERSRMQRLVAIGIVLLLCIVALFFYQSSQRNKKEAETNANLFHFMQQNRALVESNIEHEKKVLDTMQQLSNMYYARFKTMQKLSFSIENPKNKIALKDLEKVVFGDGEHWEAVKEVIDALYPGLRESVTYKYPEMDEMERRVFILSRFKLPRMEEAALLGISTSVLDKLRTRVHKIVEKDKKQ
jgi:tetratricopeptide (TPR) repeat protein